MKSTPSGQLLQLVEAYRDAERQPRQRIVISLGDMLIPEEEKPLIAKSVERQLYGIEELVEVAPGESVMRRSEQIVRRIRAEARWKPATKASTQARSTTVDGVLIDEVDHDTKSDLGAVLVGLDAWRRLGMDEYLEELGLSLSQRHAAAINVINRLVDPVSENALEDWVGTTALAELLDRRILSYEKKRFYRISDELLKNRKAIEAHLRKREQEQFGLERTLLLYDLTNTHFEGNALRNAKAKRGKNKQKRDDCPQVVVGMVFDDNGFALAHEVFEGNMSDGKTLVSMINQLEESAMSRDENQLVQVSKPLVILDGGIATASNRRWLRNNGYSYLVNETRQSRSNWANEFKEDESFHAVEGRDKKSPVHVRLIEKTFEDQGKQIVERIVLCKSEGRKKKEQAIRTRSEDRFVKALESLAKRIDCGKLKDRSKIERSIGRLQAQYTRIARFYTVSLQSDPKLKLAWRDREQERADADDLLGCYVLRSYEAAPMGASELWHVYITLTRAEEGFQSLKSYLGLRPVRHHIDRRCDGHIFITVLAYHLLRHILYRLEQSSDMRNWDTLKRILSSHVYVTIILPTLKQGIHRVRRAGRPNDSVRDIYTRLGISWKTLPVMREHIPQHSSAQAATL